MFIVRKEHATLRDPDYKLGQLHLGFTYSTRLKSSQVVERLTGMRGLKVAAAAAARQAVETASPVNTHRPPGKEWDAILETFGCRYLSLSQFKNAYM